MTPYVSFIGRLLRNEASVQRSVVIFGDLDLGHAGRCILFDHVDPNSLYKIVGS
jgi:hypothetical protein